MEILKLKQDRAKLIRDARGILDLADSESRELSAEERDKYDRMFVDIDNLADRITTEERQQALELELRTVEDTPIRPMPEEETRTPEEPTDPTNSPEYRDAFDSYVRYGASMETRALQMDSAPAGGYVVAPEQFSSEIITKKKDLVFVRQLARTFSIPKAESLGAPALDTEPEDATWTGEITTRDEDTAMAFGKRELMPHPAAKLLKVSKKLIRASAIDAVGFVRDRLAYKFAVTEESAFLTGSGSNQPLGVFTASDDGISTSRDVSTGNTTTTIEADNLMEQKYNLKQQYRAGCVWIFHRDGIKQINKLKDGEGRYLLTPDVRGAGFNDRLLGFPVYESEYAPNTFTTGLYVGILGDFSNYWIADALATQIQHLTELYAENNQDGFIALMEADGMPVLEEAYTRVKLA